jgi:geranylgeranyl pyrophosphate synthase
MDNLATGEIIQALTKNKVSTDNDALEGIIGNYMNKTYYKTAALMANALRAVPILCDRENPQF